MFSRLKLRTKLLVMLAPAVAVMCGLAGFGVASRVQARSTANQDRDLASLTGIASRFVHELQVERLLATTAAADPSMQLRDRLADQRDATDAAGRALVEAARSDETAAVIEAEDSRHDLVIGLADTTRRLGQVRTATNPAKVTEAYTALIREAVGSIGRLGSTSRALSEDGAGRAWLSEGIEAEWATAATASRLFDRTVDEATRARIAREVADLERSSTLLYDTFVAYASPDLTDRFGEARDTFASTALDDEFEQLATADPVEFTADPGTWPELVEQRLAQVEAVATDSTRAEIASLDRAADDAGAKVVYFAAGAVGGCLAVILLAFVVSRGIVTTLRRLTEQTEDLARRQVPALVESLRRPGGNVAANRLDAIDLGTSDEFADVAAALDHVGRSLSDVATEQHRSLRKGISEIFVNLARRNQSLLDRQIEFIDLLESNEEDPDQLEHLFRLDHLATRMRRNAESLLVLAGAEAPRRRAKPVSLDDVIRVAIGEVEDFARIDLLAVEEAEARGSTAVDIAHLLAELMENGAQYSSPEHSVGVVGRRESDGGYRVTITDRGVGMTPEKINAANDLLAEPPAVGLAMSRSLGFLVAGTLAARHGIVVRLHPTSDGGITADVHLPAALLLPAGGVDDRTTDDVIDAPAPVGEPARFDAPAVVVAAADAPAVAPTVAPAAPAAFAAPGSTALTPPIAAPIAQPISHPLPTPVSEVPGPIEPIRPIREPAAPSSTLTGWTATGEYVTLDAPDPDVAPISWSADDRPDVIPAAPLPLRLSEILPEGEAFDTGIYGLLGRPAPNEPAAPELPQRRPAAAATAPIDESANDTHADPVATAAPTRPPEERRSALFRYREGLHQGRDTTPAEPTPAEPTPAEPTPAEPTPAEPIAPEIAHEPAPAEELATEPIAAEPTLPVDGVDATDLPDLFALDLDPGTGSADDDLGGLAS